MSKGSSSTQREATEQEKQLWESQAQNLDMLTAIAEEQYGISEEERTYYEEVFREGSDTEAKAAIAKLKSSITGEEVDPASIEAVNIDSLLRDTILSATPEFQEAASGYIASNEALTKQYGEDVSGLSASFSEGIQGFTSKYQEEISSLKSAAGTIDPTLLATETGAATAGISQAYEEARKQMTGDLARRGLAGSGIEQQSLMDMYQQEAMAKGAATTQARQTALQQSEAMRATQAQLAGQEYQAGVSGVAQQYQAELAGVQNIYGVTTAADLQNYQLQQAATLQGISGLTQIAQAGTGVYSGAQNYLAQASTSAGQAAQIAGSSATGLASADANYALAQQQAQASSASGIGSLIGTVASAGTNSVIGGFLASDKRLKTNIKFKEVRNGHSIYTWDWIEGHNYGYNEGVIAQEVMETNPEAVIMMSNGYYAVDYEQLGV